MKTALALLLAFPASAHEDRDSGHWREMWNQMAARPKVQLGVRVQETTGQLRKAMGVTDDKAVLVVEVESKSPAESVGLQAGDIIVKVAGESVGSGKDVWLALRQNKAGDEVAIEYFHNRTKKRASLRLAAWSEQTNDDDEFSHGGMGPPWGPPPFARDEKELRQKLHELEVRLSALEKRLPKN